jgi:hypothetical protein
MQSIDPCTQNEIFDHNRILWAEKHIDGSWGFIYATMHQVCRWPNTTITKSVHTVGTVIGASVSINCSSLANKPGVSCGCCNLNTTWCQTFLSINWLSLDSLESYGGIGFETYKYIDSVNITRAGFTGPSGANASFWNSPLFRTGITNVSLNDLISLANSASSYMTSGNKNTMVNNLFNKHQLLIGITTNDLSNSINLRKNSVAPTVNCNNCPGYEGSFPDCSCIANDQEYPPYGGNYGGCCGPCNETNPCSEECMCVNGQCTEAGYYCV